MEKARIISLFLLFLALIIGGLRIWNSATNIEPKWDYISQAADYLEIAEETLDLKTKHLYIQETIEIYQKGPNLLGLQMLSRQNSLEEIDYLLPKVITALEQEHLKAVNSAIHTLRSVIVSMSLGVIFFGTFMGATAGGNLSYSKWSVKTQHKYIATIAASFLIVLVGSLP